MKWIIAVGMAAAATSLASTVGTPTVGAAAAGPVSASSAQGTQEPPGDFCGKVSDTGARKVLVQLKVCSPGDTNSF
jgi:hypothetical protein